MGYRVHFIQLGKTNYKTHQKAEDIQLQQNHLILKDSSGSIVAVYAANWWYKVEKV